MVSVDRGRAVSRVRRCGPGNVSVVYRSDASLCDAPRGAIYR